MLTAMALRKVVALAGAISFSAMSAALAIGANFGLFGLAAGQGRQVGNFQPAASLADATAPADPGPPQPAQAVRLPDAATLDAPPAASPQTPPAPGQPVAAPSPTAAAAPQAPPTTAATRRPTTRRNPASTTPTTGARADDHAGHGRAGGGSDDAHSESGDDD
jgi:hypothetical protein